MKLDQKLFEQIVDLLQTHMSVSGRRTLITPAFSTYERLYSQIDWSGSSRDFSVKFVRQLMDYGQVTPDERALLCQRIYSATRICQDLLGFEIPPL